MRKSKHIVIDNQLKTKISETWIRDRYLLQLKMQFRLPKNNYSLQYDHFLSTSVSHTCKSLLTQKELSKTY